MKIITLITIIIIIILITNIEAKEKNNSTFKNCIELRKIKLTENNIFSIDEQNKKFSPFLGKCLYKQLLKEILDTTSEFYIKNGYITTKPYLKEQNILDGEIKIVILIGTIEDIVHSETKESSIKLKTAFILQNEHILNLRNIETSLESINRVPSTNASFEIKPGTSYGKSIIEVKSETSTPYHFTFGIDGEKSLSDNNPDLMGVFSLDNPLGINDIFSFTYNGSRIQREYQSTEGKEFNYSFPLGSFLYELIYSDTKYRQRVEGINKTYIAHGTTDGWKLRISKILNRDQKNKFTLSAMLHHKDTKNYFENSLIEVSSYKTTLAQLNLEHLYLQNWGQLFTTYSYYRGEDWLGARSDDYYNIEGNRTSDSELEFEKYTFNTYLFYYFKDKTYTFDSNFHLQYTKDKLYYNDQLIVGSKYTVRGYSDTNLYGDNGFYIRNNLTKQFSLNYSKDYLQTLSLYLGGDYGRIRCTNGNEGNCGKIHSGTVGFKTDSKYLSSNFSWSRPYKKIKADPRRNSVFNYSITLKF